MSAAFDGVARTVPAMSASTAPAPARSSSPCTARDTHVDGGSQGCSRSSRQRRALQVQAGAGRGGDIGAVVHHHPQLSPASACRPRTSVTQRPAVEVGLPQLEELHAAPPGGTHLLQQQLRAGIERARQSGAQPAAIAHDAHPRRGRARDAHVGNGGTTSIARAPPVREGRNRFTAPSPVIPPRT